MDLGIAGRRALVCASSKGLGLACATALAREGAEVWINGRDDARLAEAAQGIEAATGAKVHRFAADLDDAQARAALIAACPDPDILVTNNHGPRVARFAEIVAEDWPAAVNSNMLAPIQFITAALPGMRARKFGRIVNITSGLVKAPPADMSLSVAARAGLTAMAKAVQIEAIADNVTINNLLPGPFRTDRLANRARRIAEEDGIDLEAAFAKLGRARGPSGRIGDPAEFGDACAYLCSAQAGFVSGQNLALDGGAYPGLI
ncbi:SDR family oxidoreductase [Novosphingobium sp. 9]|uniref:SDR family oxidoreductase n=1 Tax=Novosphingobium sp. 9 TaxID=2025349 RepID=UPI0021B5E942|nr:SDR family oxidoreductase [Novosphingobium sp. 9]